MSINAQELLSDMIIAAKNAIISDWNDLKSEITDDLETLAKSAARVKEKEIRGEITKDRAKAYLEMYQETAKILVLEVEIAKKVMAEKAWNAAAEVFRKAVTSAFGFVLPVI